MSGKRITIIKQMCEEIERGVIVIKKILTLIVVFDNILSVQKYKKETKIPKEDICVLGISKL